MSEPQVWIGGLNNTVREFELGKFLDRVGQVEELAIRTSAKDKFAFVTFHPGVNVDNAIHELDGREFQGNTIKVTRCRKRKDHRSPKRTNGRDKRPPAPENRVYIENLPSEILREELFEVGTDYGKVISARLWDEGVGKHGILEYATESDMENAISELDNRKMEGWEPLIRAYRAPPMR